MDKTQALVSDIECQNQDQEIYNIIVMVIQCLFLFYQLYTLYHIRKIFEEQASKQAKQIYYIHYTCLATSLTFIGIEITIFAKFCGQIDKNITNVDGNVQMNETLLSDINNLNMGYMILCLFYFLLYYLVSRRWLAVVKQIPENIIFAKVNSIIQLSVLVGYSISFVICAILLIYENSHMSTTEDFVYQKIMHFSIIMASFIQIVSFVIISIRFYKVVKNIYDIEHKFKKRILSFLVPLWLIGIFKCGINFFFMYLPTYRSLSESEMLQNPPPEIGILYNLCKTLMYFATQCFIIHLFYPKRNKRLNNLLTFQEENEDEEAEETQEINHSKSIEKNLICNNSEIKQV